MLWIVHVSTCMVSFFFRDGDYWGDRPGDAHAMGHSFGVFWGWYDPSQKERESIPFAALLSPNAAAGRAKRT